MDHVSKLRGWFTRSSTKYKVDYNTPQWQTPDVVVPVIQQRQYTDYNRVAVSSGNHYYFGQSSNGCSITPRKYNSIMQVHVELFSEPNTHDSGYRVQFNTQPITVRIGRTFAMSSVNNRHGQFNAYESDYNSTPGHSSVMLIKRSQH